MTNAPHAGSASYGKSCPLHPGGRAAVAISPFKVGCHDSRQADSSALCCALWCIWSHGGSTIAAFKERQGQRRSSSTEGGCQELSGVKMGVYYCQYMQSVTSVSLVVFVLLTCKVAKMHEMQSQNVSWFWAKVRDSWGRTPLHWAVVNGHRQGKFGRTFLLAHFFPTILQCCRSMVVKLLHEGLRWENCMRVTRWMKTVSNLQVEDWGTGAR